MSSSTSVPLGRQLTSLIDKKISSGDVAITSILGEICREPSSSTSELHKFSLRINSLLHANQDVAKGLTLALDYVRNVPWDIVVSSAAHWISSALTLYPLANKEAVLLLDQLLGKDAASRLEYWRNVASDGVSKYATTLIEAVEGKSDVDDEVMALMLQALSSQINLYPSVYRSQAAQVQQICSHLLTERPSLAAESSVLLAALHRTGKGSLIQTQLWAATLNLLIKDAELAWSACSSSFNTNSKEANSDKGLLPSLSHDSMRALDEGHSRLRLLLGGPPSAGVISIFLSQSTQCAVPVPLNRLVNLALMILSTQTSSLLQQDPAPEAILVASQSALLPSFHSIALTFLATLPTGVYYAQRNKVVNRILRTIEKSSSLIRCIAFNTLVILNIKINPESPILLRCARTCLHQIARLLKYTITLTETGSEANGNKDRSKKRRKMFESDQIRFTKRNGCTDLDQDDYAACIAAVKLLSTVYESLATHLNAEYYDLAQTSALILLGITEISMQEADKLSASCFYAIAEIIRMSRGTILALLTTRSSALASQGAQSDHYDTRVAANLVLQALEFTFHPRMPFKLDLRLHVDNDSIQGNAEEEPILREVDLHEDRSHRAIEAMREVLNLEGESVDMIAEQNGDITAIVAESTSHSPESPKRSTPRPSLQLSPDPVKPLHRPNTPRIGSPSLSHAIPTSTQSTIGLTTSADTGIIVSSNTNLDKVNVTSQQPLFGVSSIKPSPGHLSPSSNRVSTSNIAPLSSPLARGIQIDNTMESFDESDDESLPEIDLRSSDEEDEEPIVEHYDFIMH